MRNDFVRRIRAAEAFLAERNSLQFRTFIACSESHGSCPNALRPDGDVLRVNLRKGETIHSLAERARRELVTCVDFLSVFSGIEKYLMTPLPIDEEEWLALAIIQQQKLRELESRVLSRRH